MIDILKPVKKNIAEVILEKDFEIDLLLCGFFARGHILIEDIPGVGKTTLVQALAASLGLKSSRVQFTSDLLPSDVLGTQVYESETRSFRFHQGPVFSELVLGDELNRASPKTQSALLQALEEREVTQDGKAYPLPEFFYFVATQNPKTQIGTQALPESQLDRFLLTLSLDLISPESEIFLFQGSDPRKKLRNLKATVTSSQLRELREQTDLIHISAPVAQLISQILQHFRNSSFPGTLSTRSGLALAQAAKAWALMKDRSFVIPEDLRELCPYVLGHRILPREPVTLGQKEVRKALEEISFSPLQGLPP